MACRILLLLLVLVTSCTKEDKSLLTKLEQQLQPVRSMRSGYRIIRLDSLTDFDWDRVYFIGDNSGFDTNDKISSIIGFKWSGMTIPNGSNRLLFVHQSEVVAYVDCDTDGGAALPIWLYGCDKQTGYSRQEARFAVYRNCASGLPGSLDMVQLDCVEKFKISIRQGCTDSTLKIVNGPHLYDSTGRVYSVRH